MKIVSACLLGINCKYSGENNINEKVVGLLKDEILIPVCPEQLGGMSTPRLPAEILGEKVVNKEGIDVSEFFIRGAKEVLMIANLYNVSEAILKDGSPSCASTYIYDGSFKKIKKNGSGYCTKLLIENGVKVISENDL